MKWLYPATSEAGAQQQRVFNDSVVFIAGFKVERIFFYSNLK